MLQLRTRPSAGLWSSVRFASQLSQWPTDDSLVKAGAIVENGHRASSILSRLSDRIKAGVPRKPDTAEKKPYAHAEAAPTEHRKSRLRAISFVSARSAQKRDDAAEKWFTDVRQLDIDNVDQPGDLRPPSHKKRVRSGSLKQHEMRPRTDLDALFAHSPVRSATSLRLQAKRESGGDYASYLPSGHVDPYQLPVDYARLVLGRNKQIPLNAQTGALNVIQDAIQGRTTRQAA